LDQIPIDPFVYNKRLSREVLNIGGHNVPRVITDISKLQDVQYRDLKSIGHFYLPELDKWKMNDLGCDYIFRGDEPIEFMLPNGLKQVLNYGSWLKHDDKINAFPALSVIEYKEGKQKHLALNFLKVNLFELNTLVLDDLAKDKTLVLLLDTDNEHAMPEQRRFFFELIQKNIDIPVIVVREYEDLSEDMFQLHSATDIGGLLIDGLGDGLMISMERVAGKTKDEYLKLVNRYNNTSFGILQAARTRMSKTEYISCPSCGRTLFDLQETTAMIRKRTDHLKGVKIGIMGCIVNGPGEMADADYGYVGSGKGKITLYKGKEVVKRSVPSEKAVDELIEIIRQGGDWIEPETIE
jgi:(E)-4-hydroxy-3-methylbut-2-enyl-diphosphate synthase